jgi:hypothetical protein
MSAERPLLSRRTWLFGAIATAGSLAGGAWHWQRVRHPTAGDLAALLHRRLGHLNLGPHVVEQFAAEYVARYGALSMSAHHRDTFGGLLELAALRRRLPASHELVILRFERRLVSYFLRSTDYFTSPAGSVVKYVRFPDPYDSACTNPFANLAL